MEIEEEIDDYFPYETEEYSQSIEEFPCNTVFKPKRVIQSKYITNFSEDI